MKLTSQTEKENVPVCAIPKKSAKKKLKAKTNPSWEVYVLGPLKGCAESGLIGYSTEAQFDGLSNTVKGRCTLSGTNEVRYPNRTACVTGCLQLMTVLLHYFKENPGTKEIRVPQLIAAGGKIKHAGNSCIVNITSYD